jgi:hypothetical protein
VRGRSKREEYFPEGRDKVENGVSIGNILDVAVVVLLRM